MLKVGITGGIGSGKTTVCKVFETLGIPIYYADDRAKFLMNTDEFLVTEITKIFGEQAYLSIGELNRPHIASIAFSDKNVLQKLNALVHPVVHRDSEKWFLEQQNVPYVLKEAALHFETGGYKMLDKMITVFAPKKVRIERVMKRDKRTVEEVEARINNQMPDSEKVKLADFVIYNDGSQSLIQQIYTIHQSLIKSPKRLPF
jgi:dephospho-CoA kinase